LTSFFSGSAPPSTPLTMAESQINWMKYMLKYKNTWAHESQYFHEGKSAGYSYWDGVKVILREARILSLVYSPKRGIKWCGTQGIISQWYHHSAWMPGYFLSYEWPEVPSGWQEVSKSQRLGFPSKKHLIKGHSLK
jgi:hypothetical protein